MNDFYQHLIRIYNYLTISAGETVEFHKYKLNLTLISKKSIFRLLPDRFSIIGKPKMRKIDLFLARFFWWSINRLKIGITTFSCRSSKVSVVWRVAPVNVTINPTLLFCSLFFLIFYAVIVQSKCNIPSLSNITYYWRIRVVNCEFANSHG